MNIYLSPSPYPRPLPILLPPPGRTGNVRSFISRTKKSAKPLQHQAKERAKPHLRRRPKRPRRRPKRRRRVAKRPTRGRKRPIRGQKRLKKRGKILPAGEPPPAKIREKVREKVREKRVLELFFHLQPRCVVDYFSTSSNFRCE